MLTLAGWLALERRPGPPRTPGDAAGSALELGKSGKSAVSCVGLASSGYDPCVTSRRSGGTRLGPVIATLVLIWLVIGAVAAGQRHYFSGNGRSATCAKVSTIAVTIVAGPLNYIGANPKVKCPNPPQPSK